MAAAVPAARSGRAAGTRPGGTASSQSDGGGDRAAGAGVAAGAHALGAAQVEADSGAGPTGASWPAASTMGELLKREGLVVARKKRRKTAPYTEPWRMPMGPTGSGAPISRAGSAPGTGAIDPLTISDASAATCCVVRRWRRPTRRGCGPSSRRRFASTVAQAIRTDNGAPFAYGDRRIVAAGGVVDQAGHRAGTDRGRASRAERTARTHASHPEAGSGPPAAEDRRAQQRAFEQFRQEYNQVRPHEALGMETPASVYAHSQRAVSARRRLSRSIRTMLVRSVHPRAFRWKTARCIFEGSLIGRTRWLLPIDERWYTIYFAQFPLARFDSRLRRLCRAQRLLHGWSKGRGKFPFPCTPSPQPGGKSVKYVPGLKCQVCPRLFTILGHQ